MWRQRTRLMELQADIKNGAQLTVGDLQQVLESIGFKLDNDTIEAISQDKGKETDYGFEEMKAAAESFGTTADGLRAYLNYLNNVNKEYGAKKTALTKGEKDVTEADVKKLEELL